MGRSLLTALLLTLALAVALPCIAQAAEIHAGLASELEAIGNDDFVSVILIMRDQADVSALNTRLKAERAKLAVRHEQVVTALRAATASQGPLLTELAVEQSRGGRVGGFTPYWISNLIVAQVTKGYVYDLAARADVASIEPNFTVELIEPVGDWRGSGAPRGESDGPQRGIGVTPGLRAINADDVWYELGINGTGVIVGNCDTGVDGNHPALASRWRGLYAPASQCWLNLIGGHPSFPYDGNSHGTHVMGTITGLGAATGDTIGVAWGALWIATDPINQGASGEFDNDIIAAYQWFADPDGNPNTSDEVPDVVQNSWRVHEGFGYPDCDSRWWAVIDNCEAAGCVTTWSAGNEGYGTPQTIGSPADRATTLTNCFSVGAIDATNYGYPWPIADFSSLGPTGCPVAPDHKIKPEVVAPGVDVYSSVPGGSYQQWGWSGTSMAGPHVAGVVALMREANPDLDVDTIKEILMATAVDLGPNGEENTFGWGVIDAYDAVIAAMTGFGQLAGTVTNVTNGGTPAAGVTIEVIELDRATTSGPGGTYAMSIAPGVYTVRATHPSFVEQTFTNVVVVADETTVRNFALTDVGAPEITDTTELDSTSDTVGPYPIETTVIDAYSRVAYARIQYRVDGGDFRRSPLSLLNEHRYLGSLPGQPYTTLVEYYIEAADIGGNVGTDPAGAPGSLYSFYVAPGIVSLDEDVESGSPDWTHASGTAGYGDQWHVSTQRNHTAGGSRSWKCGSTGSSGYANLLDAALVTPSFEIAEDQTLSFWHWIEAQTMNGYPTYANDGGIVEISVEGAPWQPLTPLEGYSHTIVRTTTPPGPLAEGTPCFSGSHGWEEVNVDLGELAGSNARLRFRFASDASIGLEGWYIDDVIVNGFVIEPMAAPEVDGLRLALLYPADPNPFTGDTSLRFSLAAPGRVDLELFDPAGRLVRTLLSGTRTPGLHQVTWDGRDDQARPVAPGVYLCRLQVEGQVSTGKVIVAR